MAEKIGLDLYRKLFLYRTVEEKISTEYASGKMRCPVHLAIGQELLPAIYSTLIQPGDLAVSTHRAHLHFLAHGGSPESLFSELLGKSRGCSSGFGGSMHLVDRKSGFLGSTAIVGNSIPVGVGIALAEKLKQRRSVTTVFFGEAATEEGVFFESLNYAASSEIPMLFICENNGFSVYSGLTGRQPAGRSLSRLAEAIGVRAWENSGDDPADLSFALELALSCVRDDSKPAFLEVHSFRRYEHCGPAIDDHLRYRSVLEVEKGLSRDPVPRVRIELVRTMGLREVEDVEEEIRVSVESDYALSEASQQAECMNFDDIVYAS
jgi:TPP-dependent pyruvate/acetoin dehydrogenase alpha subunit